MIPRRFRLALSAHSFTLEHFLESLLCVVATPDALGTDPGLEVGQPDARPADAFDDGISIVVFHVVLILVVCRPCHARRLGGLDVTQPTRRLLLSCYRALTRSPLSLSRTSWGPVSRQPVMG